MACADRIPLPSLDQVNAALSYDPETGILHRKARPDIDPANNARNGGKVAGSKKPSGYVLLDLMGQRYRAHRLIWLIQTGEQPPDLIDHINLDRADNRWCNLRAATTSENVLNTPRRADNRSGFKGVRRAKRSPRWEARLRRGGKQVRLGLFDTPEAAYAAYCEAAKAAYGDFARSS